jgi:hypothetical protein
MNIDEFEDYLDINNIDNKNKIRKSFLEYKAKKTRPADKLLKELRK